MKVTIDLDNKDIGALKSMIQGDLDSDKKNTLSGILWYLAELVGIIDSDGKETGGDHPPTN